MKALISIFILTLCPATVLATGAEAIGFSTSAKWAVGKHKMCENLARMAIHSHRGAFDYPENSIAAFRRAVGIGADYVEMDLQISKDNHLVVAHDAYVKPECFGLDSQRPDDRTFFRNLNLDEIKKMDCGTHVKLGVSVPGERIATLVEVMEALKQKRTYRDEPLKLNIEIKYNPTQPQYYPSREFYVSQLFKVLDDSGYDEARLLVQSFDVEILKEIRRQEIKLNRSPLRLSPLLSEGKNAVQVAKSIAADLITPHYKQVSAERIQECHRNGIQVTPWTVNSADDIMQMVEWGVDGVITDRPDLFVDLRERYCTK